MLLLRPEEVGGGSSRVALLGVEEEPVAVLELLLRDIPDHLFVTIRLLTAQSYGMVCAYLRTP